MICTTLGKTCTNGICECPTGQIPDPLTGICKSCPIGQVPDPGTGKCVQCTSSSDCAQYPGGGYNVCNNNRCGVCTSDFQCNAGGECSGAAGICCPAGTLSNGAPRYQSCPFEPLACHDLLTDPTHCGTCGTNCLAPTFPDCTNPSPSCKIPGTNFVDCKIPGCCGKCTSCNNGQCTL